MPVPDRADDGATDERSSLPRATRAVDVARSTVRFGFTQAEDVASALVDQRGLLTAAQSLAGNLSLPMVMHQIVQSGCELVQARYGALGVIGPTGELDQFVHVGMDPDTVANIGALPEGRGLLGASIVDPRPIRLRTMADDPRSAGFPAGHPAMTSFLGVPVRVGDEAFGNLYLTESQRGEFTARDEELVSALAVIAGLAIHNAQLYEVARRRQESLEAFNEVARQLLAADGEEPLQLIARQGRQIVDAQIVSVVLPTADGRRLMVEAADGERANELTATTSPLEGSLTGLALDTGQPVLVGDVSHDQRSTRMGQAETIATGPVMVVPFGGSQRMRGALVFGRTPGGRPFAEPDVELATMFANHAAVSMELAAARADQQRVVLLEDRARIARDLHDHSIQRMFAIGLSVQSVARNSDDRPAAARLNQAVTDIDETIRQIRTFIFQLRGSLGPETGTVRAKLLDVIAELGPLVGSTPQMVFTGPIDALVPDPVADDLVAVLREALTNIARHAQADRVDVEVVATTTELSLDVIDDGVGMSTTARRSGLANLRERAERRGGSLTLSRGQGQQPRRAGTHLRWAIPLT
jgi:signal transduction histidine kinase